MFGTREWARLAIGTSIIAATLGCTIEPRAEETDGMISRPTPPELIEKLKVIPVAGHSHVLTPELCDATPANRFTPEDISVAVPVDPWLPASGQRAQIAASIKRAAAITPDKGMGLLDLAALAPRDRLTYRVAPVKPWNQNGPDLLLFGWPDAPVRIVVWHYPREKLEAAGFDTALWDRLVADPDAPITRDATEQPLPEAPSFRGHNTVRFPPFGPRTHVTYFEDSTLYIDYDSQRAIGIDDSRDPLEYFAPGVVTAQTAGMPHDGPWSRMVRVPAGQLTDAGIDLRQWVRFERPGLYMVGAYYAHALLEENLDRQIDAFRDNDIDLDISVLLTFEEPGPIGKIHYIAYMITTARYIPADAPLPQVRSGQPDPGEFRYGEHDERGRDAEWRNNTYFAPEPKYSHF